MFSEMATEVKEILRVLAGRVLVHIFFLGKFFSLAVRPAAEWAEPMQRGPGLGVERY
jgi:hypothetical protein